MSCWLPRCAVRVNTHGSMQRARRSAQRSHGDGKPIQECLESWLHSLGVGCAQSVGGGCPHRTFKTATPDQSVRPAGHCASRRWNPTHHSGRMVGLVIAHGDTVTAAVHCSVDTVCTPAICRGALAWCSLSSALTTQMLTFFIVAAANSERCSVSHFPLGKLVRMQVMRVCSATPCSLF